MVKGFLQSQSTFGNTLRSYVIKGMDTASVKNEDPYGYQSAMAELKPWEKEEGKF